MKCTSPVTGGHESCKDVCPPLLLGGGTFLVLLFLHWLLLEPKHGADSRKRPLYSVLFLGIMMVCYCLGIEASPWVSLVVTFAEVGLFFVRSREGPRRVSCGLPQP
jgi:hypothetical protein